MTYTRYHSDWKSYPDTTTPIDAAGLEHIEEGIEAAHLGLVQAAQGTQEKPFGIHRALSLHATTRCALIMVGDSRPEGTGKDNIAETYRYKYQQLLRDMYDAHEDTGRGYIPVVYFNGSGWAEAPVASGTPSSRGYEGLGYRSVIFDTAGDMFTWTLYGTHATFCYPSIPSAGKSEYRITPAATGVPGAWVEINHSNGSGLFTFTEEALTVNLGGGVVDTYTVEWRFKSTGSGVSPNPIIEGIIEINGDPTKGIVVLDAAHGGITSTNYLTHAGQIYIPRYVTLHGIKGMLIDILTNDWQTGQVTASQSADNLQTLINLYQGVQPAGDPFSDVMILAPWEPRAPLGDPLNTWDEYRSSIYEMAASNPYVHIVDTRKYLPEPDGPGDIPSVTDGYYDFLALHPEEIGDEVIARIWLTETTPTTVSNYYPTPVDYQDHGSAGATETLDLNNGKYHRIVLNANLTLTLTNAVSGTPVTITIEVVQDATGSRTITYPASVKWPGGVVAVHSATANAKSLIELRTRDGGTTWFGNLIGAAYA